MLYGARLRVSEAIGLTLGDVDLPERLLTIRKTKFYKSRLVPIGQQLSAALTRYIEQRSALPTPYKGTDVHPTGGSDMGTTQLVKNARYDKMMEAFGGIGVHVKTPTELDKALKEAVASGKPTLINAVIDETAGTESGRITSLNPQTAAAKK